MSVSLSLIAVVYYLNFLLLLNLYPAVFDTLHVKILLLRLYDFFFIAREIHKYFHCHCLKMIPVN